MVLAPDMDSLDSDFTLIGGVDDGMTAMLLVEEPGLVAATAAAPGSAVAVGPLDPGVGGSGGGKRC